MGTAVARQSFTVLVMVAMVLNAADMNVISTCDVAGVTL